MATFSINFELIFSTDVRMRSILLSMGTQLFEHHAEKAILFLLSCLLLIKVGRWFVWVSDSSVLCPSGLFFSVSHSLDYLPWVCRTSLNQVVWGLGGSLTIKSTCCSCRGPRFSSQHLVATAFGNSGARDLTASLTFTGMSVVHICACRLLSHTG